MSAGSQQRPKCSQSQAGHSLWEWADYNLLCINWADKDRIVCEVLLLMLLAHSTFPSTDFYQAAFLAWTLSDT